MKWLIVYSLKLITLVAAIYSLLQVIVYSSDNFFAKSKDVKLKHYLVLIGLFSLMGISGDLLQPFTEVSFVGLANFGPILAGLLGGLIPGLATGILLSLYGILVNQQMLLITIVSTLFLGIFAGFFSIGLVWEEKIDYKQIIIKRLLPVGILYLFLTLNIIYKFNVAEISIILIKFVLNLSGLVLVLFLIDKLRKKIMNDKEKNKELTHLKKSVKKLNGLHEMVQEVNSSTNINQIFESVVRITCKALEIEAGGIMILDEDKETLSFKNTRNFNRELIPEEIDYEIFKSVIAKQQLTIKSEEEFDSRFEFIKKSNYNNLLAAPLIEDEDVYGVLFVAQREVFCSGDLQVLNTLATQASFLIKKNQLFKKMQKNVAELSTLQRISQTINSTLNLEQVMELAIDVIVGTMGVSSCAVMLIDEKEELNLEASRGLLKDCAIEDNVSVNDYKFVLETLKTEKPLVYNEVPKVIEEELGISELKSAITVPLKLRDDVIGIIVAINTLMSHSFNDEDKRFLTTLANQVAIAIENARIYNRMEEMAIKDGLTQLYNHSHFQESLAEEINRAERYEQNLSLLLLDIDNFKDFNDTYGHPVGDEVLKKLAETLQEITRDIDVVARYGGEEFTVILPETDLEGAKQVGCRINQAIREMVVEEDGLELNVTVSIGAAVYDPSISQKELINHADQALYRAKEEGKDRTCIA